MCVWIPEKGLSREKWGQNLTSKCTPFNSKKERWWSRFTHGVSVIILEKLNALIACGPWKPDMDRKPSV